MNFKKLLCTAFLALACCATSASAFNERDIIDAESIEFSLNRFGVPDDALSPSYLYFESMFNHLSIVSVLGYERYIRSSSFKNDVHSIPVLSRHYREGSFNAENFKEIMKDALRICSLHMPSYTEADLRYAKTFALLETGSLSARTQYYRDMRDYLRAVIRQGYGRYVRSPRFRHDAVTMPVLMRHCGSRHFCAENFKEVMRGAIALFDHLIATSRN